MTTTTVTVTPTPIKPDVPLWLTGHQCPRIEYNPTSEYKFKKGEKTGWGVICQFTSRSQKEMNAIYVGGLEERRAEGYGEWHSEDEKIAYHGGWKDNVANGYGKFTDSWTQDWPDSWARFLPGDAESTAKYSYEGGFLNGYFHGYGELTFKDKSKYEGSWKEGRRWGYGKYTRDNGQIVEFSIEAIKKPDPPKKDDKKDKKDEKKTEEKITETKTQVIFLQQPQQQPQQPVYQQPIYQQPQQQTVYQPVVAQPVIAQPVIAQPVIPQPVIPQPVLQVTNPHEHSANAGVSFTWGHGSPTQTATQPQIVYQPVEARPITPQPIPVQYTYPPRPLTPQPHRNSQSYLVTVPTNPQLGTPGSPPYPDIEPITLTGSPPNTSTNAYFPHM